MLVSLFKEVRVPYDIINEVEQLSPEKAESIGFSVYYPEPATYYEAVNAGNSISFEDNVCVIDARENNWAVITNDKTMKNYCSQAGVTSFWGLQVLLFMVEQKLIVKRTAMNTAVKIFKNNPWISNKVLNDFRELIEKL